MDLTTAIIGSHAWFFREGDAFAVPAPGVCGAESKPGIEPDFDAGWIDLGAIESADPTMGQEEFKLWKPAPGRLVLKDIPENKQELSYKIVTNDVGPLAIEVFYRATQKVGGAQLQFNPLSAPSRRGWMHLQKYNSGDGLWLTLDLYSRLRINTLKMDGTPTKPEWDLYVLYSSLNTGAIT